MAIITNKIPDTYEYDESKIYGLINRWRYLHENHEKGTAFKIPDIFRIYIQNITDAIKLKYEKYPELSIDDFFRNTTEGQIVNPEILYFFDKSLNDAKIYYETSTDGDFEAEKDLYSGFLDDPMRRLSGTGISISYKEDNFQYRINKEILTEMEKQVAVAMNSVSTHQFRGKSYQEWWDKELKNLDGQQIEEVKDEEILAVHKYMRRFDNFLKIYKEAKDEVIEHQRNHRASLDILRELESKPTVEKTEEIQEKINNVKYFMEIDTNKLRESENRFFIVYQLCQDIPNLDYKSFIPSYYLDDFKDISRDRLWDIPLNEDMNYSTINSRNWGKVKFYQKLCDEILTMQHTKEDGTTESFKEFYDRLSVIPDRESVATPLEWDLFNYVEPILQAKSALERLNNSTYKQDIQKLTNYFYVEPYIYFEHGELPKDINEVNETKDRLENLTNDVMSSILDLDSKLMYNPEYTVDQPKFRKREVVDLNLLKIRETLTSNFSKKFLYELEASEFREKSSKEDQDLYKEMNLLKLQYIQLNGRLNYLFKNRIYDYYSMIARGDNVSAESIKDEINTNYNPDKHFIENGGTKSGIDFDSLVEKIELQYKKTMDMISQQNRRLDMEYDKSSTTPKNVVGSSMQIPPAPKTENTANIETPEDISSDPPALDSEISSVNTITDNPEDPFNAKRKSLEEELEAIRKKNEMRLAEKNSPAQSAQGSGLPLPNLSGIFRALQSGYIGVKEKKIRSELRVLEQQSKHYHSNIKDIESSHLGLSSSVNSYNDLVNQSDLGRKLKKQITHFSKISGKSQSEINSDLLSGNVDGLPPKLVESFKGFSSDAAVVDVVSKTKENLFNLEKSSENFNSLTKAMEKNGADFTGEVKKPNLNTANFENPEIIPEGGEVMKNIKEKFDEFIKKIQEAVTKMLNNISKKLGF